MTDQITLCAHAKINLSLSVIGQSDGMHLLDTVMCPLAMGDIVSVQLAPKTSLAYADGRGSYPNDSALRAAKIVEDLTGKCLQITIDKRIPEGAGLGGSSADAAAVFRAATALFGTKFDPKTLAAVGGDVPALYLCQPVRQRGRSQDVTPICIPPLHTVILVGKDRVSTARCFEVFDQMGGEGTDIDSFLLGGAKFPQNALQRAAESLSLDISHCVRLLTEAGAENVVMTGSGCGVIAYSQEANAIDAVAERVRTACGGLQILRTTTI